MLAQRNGNLERAQQFRMIQAMFKRNLAEHSMTVGLSMAREAITDPPDELGGMRVEKLLMAVHAIGIDKAGAILRKVHVSPTRRLRDLTDNERDRLGAALR